MFEDSVFCLLKRENVPVLWTPLPLHDGHATLPDAAVPVCLGFGDHCGARCATFQVPRPLMAAWVARSGNGAGRLPIRAGRCALCGTVGELQQVDDDSGYCPACGGLGPLEPRAK